MTAHQMASTTMMWLKQLTTGTVSSVKKNMDNIGFLRNNRKGLAIVLPLWCVVVIVGYLGVAGRRPK